MLACDHLFNAVLSVHRFSDGIAPPSPIHTEPVIPLDAGLQFKLEFSQWRPPPLAFVVRLISWRMYSLVTDIPS